MKPEIRLVVTEHQCAGVRPAVVVLLGILLSSVIAALVAALVGAGPLIMLIVITVSLAACLGGTVVAFPGLTAAITIAATVLVAAIAVATMLFTVG